MDDWRRSLKLYELLEEAENVDRIPNPPSGIYILPPEDANADVTDNDSGDENYISPTNLPGSQLRAEVEVIADVHDDSYDEEDNIPLGRRFQVPPKRLKSGSWVEEDLGHEQLVHWNDQFGPSNMLNPLEIFECIFNSEVIDLITTFTNGYAAQRNMPADVTSKEVKCFLGVLLLSGYVVHPYRYMYWENRNDTHNEAVSSAISRDRFSYIMKVIHFCDNNNLDQKDKYAKMRPLFDQLNKIFQELAPFEENHSIDEAMIPYYGRHSCKQFIRMKPLRWGYKFWVGALRLGYIVWFSPYQGASAELPKRYQDLGLGTSVVLTYADVLENRWPKTNFHLFFDNYFTSLHLLNELKKRGLRGTGTIRENRLLNCNLSSTSEMKKSSRGKFVYKMDRDTDIVVCRWNDNSVVTVATNCGRVQPTSSVKRFSQKEKRHVNVEQSNMIKIYNTNMGGVDRGDQNISLYRVSIRGKKWYFPLFAHCLDMAAQNAWHLHRLQGGKLDQVSFRRAIATTLLESNRRDTKKRPSKRNSQSQAFSKYDGVNHIIVYKESQARCGFCHKKVQFKCEKCDIPLHPKFCFKNFHTE